MDIPLPPLLTQLCDLLGNSVLPAELTSAIRAPQGHPSLFLNLEASLIIQDRSPRRIQSFELGCIDLRDGALVPHSPLSTNSRADNVEDEDCSTSEPSLSQAENLRPSKRHKTTSGLRLPHSSSTKQQGPSGSCDNETLDDLASSKSTRQVHTDTRFPQRVKPGQGISPPVLEPTSTDKLIAGIWRQVHSPVQLSRDFSDITPRINIRTGASLEVFQTVNELCLKYYNRCQSSRALEMIVQAYWVDCFEARVAVIQFQKPIISKAAARMMAVREACLVLDWKEKDLRNRMAIWRGYKEIKEYGGWASLIFASAGVYRFCKYRSSFGEDLFSRLRHIRSSVEVAADTLHPGWRDLLKVIQQDIPSVYHGHPHDWVIMADGPALPLASTYEHLSLPNGLQYTFIDECVLDESIFGDRDPRRVPELDPDICSTCHEKQSDDIQVNQCLCFASLFGCIRGPVPLQIYRTSNGKNNGVVARCAFPRGTAIAEFTGLITSGIEGADVMIGGSRGRTYQIHQGTMGNFTRFINHSCRPNSQFQRFYWKGMERIIVVSKGIGAGTEITVDYSDRYWKELNKKCLCGEACCRF
ncbi:hypothetical protein BJY04DRAFT_176372, partial [Aspergillus karnatakaensis]|uniref:SET domain-containing protein n=1 Tax=Aspergillus karnatakaensis TaxID=1810916 RepID=UPI003CCD7E8A